MGNITNEKVRTCAINGLRGGYAPGVGAGLVGSEGMTPLRFEGYSDDTFACTGPGIDVDYDNCANGKPIFMRVDGAAGGLVVRGQYAEGPCGGWSIAVAPADHGVEEHHIPEWPMRIERSDREYSPRLVIEADDDVRVSLITTEAGR